MKSQFVTALTVAGVLGTAGTAMAANTDVLALVSDSPIIGGATQVLLPTPSASPSSTASATPRPVATPTPTPTPTTPAATSTPAAGSSTQSYSGTTGAQNSSRSNPVVTAPAPVVNGTTAGSGTRAPAASGTEVKKVEVHTEHPGEDDD